MEKISREKFVRLAGTVGVGVAAASISACGGSGGSESGGSSSEETAAKTTAEKADGSGIAAQSDVKPGSAMKFKDGGEDAVLVHLENGDFVAYSAVCTHQGCVVAFKDGQLACPCHGSVFDPSNGGEVVTGPAKQPLPEIPVEVQDGNVVKA
ncbi:MAG: ubiquinol-cytochrome c reductase iron-sulfur subunit [Rubrobacteraceae bacterium]